MSESPKAELDEDSQKIKGTNPFSTFIDQTLIFTRVDEFQEWFKKGLRART